MLSYKNTFQTFTENDTFMKFEVIEQNNTVGYFSFCINQTSIELTTFEIFKSFRGKQFGKKSLNLLNEIIYELAEEFKINYFHLKAVPFNQSSMNVNQLSNFYKKYLFVENKDTNSDYLYKKL